MKFNATSTPSRDPGLSRLGTGTRRAGFIGIVAAAVLLASIHPGGAEAAVAPSLGTAQSFAVLAGSAVNNTGPTVITGDLGVSPGTQVTGFTPGVVLGTIHAGDMVAEQAQLDLTVAYNDLAGRVGCAAISGNVGGQTLFPGVYCSTESLSVTAGDLTLDAQGDANAVFIFQIASSLTTAPARQVILTGDAQSCNVFWQVGTSATLGANTSFSGNILADQSITLSTGARVDGRVLARIDAVTLDSNVVDATSCAFVDTDGDGIADATDNCPAVSNAAQTNSDAAIDNGPMLSGDDRTVPNGTADADGDACETDGDVDNDGLADAAENPLAGCAAFNGAAAGHPSPAGGDISNDDNGNGNPALPMGTDAADNGPSGDTDNDGANDGYECLVGTNPRDRLSKPALLGAPIPPAGYPDGDGDGLPDDWESRGWGTNPGMQDSDLDGLKDCKEVADVDGNGVVNSTGDFIFYANTVFLGAGKTQDFDLDKNGVVNSTGDFIQEAKWVFLQQPCL